ncbi:hypothetical protein Adeg_0775 [Ammonifex degensii KC4]|uniref:Uncharacterized protein n=1 Tax=Ammonifex degensii (strain DSM 10501 / KC4) TaxID=429009 RepID=C9RCE1_AMMDK|nr:hypothetical protein [Ammonifex degensii]ACX51918.1 hypothetical protein Adeg_0775 [Ammonifex degensii KC4]
MRILCNLPPDKRERLSLASRVEFAGLDARGSYGEDDVCLVVRSPGFEAHLEKAVATGLCVVVVAGTRDPEGEEVVRRSLGMGVPPECVLLKENGRVVDAAGNDFGPAPQRGIDYRPVVDAARRALAEGLRPCVLVWEEAPGATVGPTREEGVWEEEESKVEVNRPSSVVPASLGDLLDLAGAVTVFFRAALGGEEAVVEYARGRDGVLLELGKEPRLFTFFGGTVEEAAGTGRYAYSDGGRTVAGPVPPAPHLVVDAYLTADVPLDALEAVHRRAGKTYLVASGQAEVVRGMVEVFRANGWRLDGVVPADPALDHLIRELRDQGLEVVGFPGW